LKVVAASAAYLSAPTCAIVGDLLPLKSSLGHEPTTGHGPAQV
jgi:hypothetical protein